ncbi:hypothetical protein ACP4OV_028710 [Aristida adscensionis]
MSMAGGRGGGARGLQPPPVAVDVGCTCRTPRLLLGSLISSLKSHARGKKPPSPHAAAASSLWSSSTPTAPAFTSSTATTTTASSFDGRRSPWGGGLPAAPYAADAAEAEAEEEATRQRRRRRRRRRRRSGCRREQGSWETAAEAVAVEVESAAPYEDFRESMAAMVREKEMYAWEELNALLHQFLALNSPRHHPLILAAFADLWAPRAGLFAPPSPCLLL